MATAPSGRGPYGELPPGDELYASPAWRHAHPGAEPATVAHYAAHILAYQHTQPPAFIEDANANGYAVAHAYSQLHGIPVSDPNLPPGAHGHSHPAR